MLSVEDISRLLESNGFIDKHEIKKIIRYKYPDFEQYIYVNKEAGSNYSGLVIHPRYRSYSDYLLAVPQVYSQQKYIHKAGMGKFPKRQNKGKDEIPYGLPFGFNSEPAFDNFINKLTRLPAAYSRNEIEEIEEAEEDLKDLSNTEKQSIVNARIGQGKFRKQLIDLWGKCSVTGCASLPLLKASHIKPWRDSNNSERLDKFNGFLLAPNLDSCFDAGLITFENSGSIVISSALDITSRTALGINSTLSISGIKKENFPFLEYHRNYIFQP